MNMRRYLRRDDPLMRMMWGQIEGG